MAIRSIEAALASVRGVSFTTMPPDVEDHVDNRFTRGYIPDHAPHGTNGFYDVEYFTGEKASNGVSFSPNGEFLDPESHYKEKWQDTVGWISQSVPKGNILDVGQGPGHLAYWAERMNPDLQVYGCDVALPLLQSPNNQNQHYSVASLAYELPFKDGLFQGVLFSDVLEHVWPQQAVEGVREAHRLLDDGGSIFVRIPNRNTWTGMAARDEGHVWLPNLDETKELLVRGGFAPGSIQITTRGFPFARLQPKQRDIKAPLLGRAILASARK